MVLVALNITTTNTIVYQQDATYSEPSNFRHPLYQHEVSSRIRLQEFNDADQLELGETLAGIIYANDYPGTFKIETSIPERWLYSCGFKLLTRYQSRWYNKLQFIPKNISSF